MTRRPAEHVVVHAHAHAHAWQRLASQVPPCRGHKSTRERRAEVCLPDRHRTNHNHCTSNKALHMQRRSTLSKDSSQHNSVDHALAYIHAHAVKQTHSTQLRSECLHCSLKQR